MDQLALGFQITSLFTYHLAISATKTCMESFPYSMMVKLTCLTCQRVSMLECSLVEKQSIKQLSLSIQWIRPSTRLYISARPTGGCARRAIHCISLVTSGFCGHASPSLLQLLTNRFICILVSKFCNQFKDFASIILLTRNNYGLNWLKYFLFLPFFHWKQIKLVHWKGYHSTDKNIWIQIFDWAGLLTNYNAMLCDVFFAWNGFKEAKGLTSLFLLCLSVLCLWTYVCTYIALELDCTLINDFKPGIIAQCLKSILLRR